MTSPFPGMDPFLEDPSIWSSVHARLINSISDILADIVSPNFFVDIEQRVYITTLDDPEKRPIVPDVYVVTSPETGQAVATTDLITEPTLVEPIYDLEIRDRYIEIRDTLNREVVTTIEILSPFNKASGTSGREAFLRKRKTMMTSKVHWIEVDLLRAGQRPPEVSDKSDYYVLLKRGDTYGPFAVWYIDLRDRLPVIAVPLRPPFDDVPLDLQQAFDQVYTRAHYADSMDYHRPVPQPDLRPADATWIKTQVQVWLNEQQAG